MKRIICLLYTLCLLSTIAMAENIDVSNLSIDELALLRDRCLMEIMKSERWQEVKVPAGVYQIGKEIPAGRWTIKPVDGDTAVVQWGTALDASGTKLDVRNSDFLIAEQITSPNDSYAKYNNVESVTWQLRENDYIVIESSAVIFSPYAGAEFSFK